MTVPNDPFDRLHRALQGPVQPSSDFDLNLALHPGPRNLRPAAVLVGLMPAPDGLRVVLTKRSAQLKHHPGQIAFPGGKLDATDPSLVAAALREAHEEVGLDPSSVEVLGIMPAHETVTGFNITPVLARLPETFRPTPETGEVDEVFFTPFSHLADPARYRVEHRIWGGQRRAYYTVPWGPYYIWGATARILRALAERMQP
jgi:8-oxo-dGTP pyrophosphatase MutT (NUDIX family)